MTMKYLRIKLLAGVGCAWAAVPSPSPPAPRLVTQAPVGADAVPDKHAILLGTAYTLDAHWAAIGVNVSAVVSSFKYLEQFDTYFIQTSDQNLLTTILKDPMAVEVEQQLYYSLDDGETTGQPYTLPASTRNGTDDSGTAGKPADGRQLWDNNA
jgi:hypothetical protein